MIKWIFISVAKCTRRGQEHDLPPAPFIWNILFLILFSLHLPTTYNITTSLFLIFAHRRGGAVCVYVCELHLSELIGCDRSQGRSQITAVNTDLHYFLSTSCKTTLRVSLSPSPWSSSLSVVYHSLYLGVTYHAFSFSLSVPLHYLFYFPLLCQSSFRISISLYSKHCSTLPAHVFSPLHCPLLPSFPNFFHLKYFLCDNIILSGSLSVTLSKMALIKSLLWSAPLWLSFILILGVCQSVPWMPGEL